jgi:5-methylcytosine-specific restriction protein A
MALYDDGRGNSGDRGYDGQWGKVRDLKLSQDPLCEICKTQGEVKTANLVHHVKPIDERPDLRLDMNNLMSVCTEHHEEIHKKERWRKKS